jgi:hypothetical protein
VSERIPAERDARTWRSEDLLDAAAAIVGAAAGYRSFCIAVGRPIRVATIGETLIAGLPSVLEQRRRRARGSRTTEKKRGRTRS